jgi:hypothetical protein
MQRLVGGDTTDQPHHPQPFSERSLTMRYPTANPVVSCSVAVTALFASSLSAAAGADVSDYELRRLFEPTEAERAQEHAGRIYIYDGLRDVDIRRAMREEFERVEHMMFIREKRTDEHGEVKTNPATGEAVVEDDGC